LGASLAVRRSVVDSSWTANRERDGAGRGGEGRAGLAAMAGERAVRRDGAELAQAGSAPGREGGWLRAAMGGRERTTAARSAGAKLRASSRRLTRRGRCSASPLQLRARRREGEEWWRSEGAGRGRRRQLGGRSERRQGEEYAAEERAERRNVTIFTVR